MKLSDIREEALIERIVKEHLLPTSAPGLVVGVGDDAAVLSSGEDGMTIVTTDMLTEGMDFRLDIITPYLLGWKSVAVNISDIAAMGGVPTWTFVSLGLRPELDVEFVDEFYRGIKACTEEFGSRTAGGDMNSVKGDICISVTQLGKVECSHLTLRSGARPGDKILVTGWLGNSRGGLELLLKYGFDEASRISAYLVEAHLMPEPRVSEARVAAEAGALNALMDLSDGLGADLPKLCKASGFGALVYADELPISEDLRRAAELLGTDPLTLAAGGGEDFELLMAVRPEDAADLKSAVEYHTRTRVTEIGEITENRDVEIVYSDGTRRELSGGWEHFT